MITLTLPYMYLVQQPCTSCWLGTFLFHDTHTHTHTRFRLVSRAMAAFLHCQMPIDGKQTTLLRVAPNAPGHVKDPPRQHNPTGIGATKQGNHTCSALEALLADKHYAALREHTTYAVNFVNNPSNCIVNCNHLLVYLSTVLYPGRRFLDLLRVLQHWCDFFCTFFTWSINSFG